MIDFKNVISQIEENFFSPFYLLSGIETFFIDKIELALTSKLVKEESKDFDYSILYGRDTTITDLIEIARRYPLIGEYNFIVVREAQYLHKGLDDLSNYLENPPEKTIIAFCYKYKNFDKRKTLYKVADKKGTVVTFEKIYENKLPDFISTLANTHNLLISEKNIKLLADSLGSDLKKIDNELIKLNLVVTENREVTTELIEEHVGFNKDFNNFELQKAIGLRNFSKSFQIIKHISADPKKYPLVLSISTLHSFFSKILIFHALKNPLKEAPSKLGVSPFFVNQYSDASKNFSMKQSSEVLSLIFDADLKSKGIKGSLDHFAILNDLMIKVFNV